MSAFAREFRATDTQSEPYPTIHERKQAEAAGVIIVSEIDKTPFEGGDDRHLRQGAARSCLGTIDRTYS